MRGVKGKVLVLVVVFVGFGAVCALAGSSKGAAKEGRAKAFELLDKYAETQDKLQSSFIIKAEYPTVVNSYIHFKGALYKARDMKQKRLLDLRTGGDRISSRRYKWGEGYGPKPVSKDKAFYNSYLWDGKYYSSYARGGTNLGTLVFEKEGDDTFKKGMISRSPAHERLGFFFGDYERVDLVLRTSENISVREKKEKAGASDCYVINAVVRNRGRYTLWIDPEHGYNIAQARIIRGEKDEIWGEKPKRIKLKAVDSINNVRFEKIDDLWVPAEAYIELDRKWDDGEFSNEKGHYKLVEFLLDPDHEALGSFDRGNDVKNGAEVHFLGNDDIFDYSDGPQYKWVRGARYVVDDKGRVVSYDPNEKMLPVVKTLPDLRCYKIKKSLGWSKDKIVVMCFIEIKQRASQECVTELKGLPESLAEKRVVVVLVQASDIEAEELERWKRKNKIRLALGRLPVKRIKEHLGAWGVERLPWLILADREHIVTAEGFGLDELEKKIKEACDAEL